MKTLRACKLICNVMYRSQNLTNIGFCLQFSKWCCTMGWRLQKMVLSNRYFKLKWSFKVSKTSSKWTKKFVDLYYLDIIILLKGQTIAYKKDKTHINLLIEIANSFVKQTVTKNIDLIIIMVWVLMSYLFTYCNVTTSLFICYGDILGAQVIIP